MKQETLEEACLNYSTDMLGSFYEEVERAFAKGAKWQQERSYSEEDIKLAFEEGFNVCICVTDNIYEAKECFEEWFNRFKKK